jgi:hypothetical protein
VAAEGRLKAGAGSAGTRRGHGHPGRPPPLLPRGLNYLAATTVQRGVGRRGSTAFLGGDRAGKLFTGAEARRGHGLERVGVVDRETGEREEEDETRRERRLSGARAARRIGLGAGEAETVGSGPWPPGGEVKVARTRGATGQPRPCVLYTTAATA